MNPVENFRATANELVSVAQKHGIDLEPVRKDFTFQKDRRWVDVWRKDELPYSGPPGEKLGTLHYNMQGTISAVPAKLKETTDAFRGMWSEAGTVDSLEQAVQLVKAWLLDWNEVDELPGRSVRRYEV